MSTRKIVSNIEKIEFMENQKCTKKKYITKRNIVTALLVVLLVILGVTVFVQTFRQNDSDQLNTFNKKRYQRNVTLIKKRYRNVTLIKKEVPIAMMPQDYSRQIKGKQFQDKICQSETDKKFTAFARGFVGSSYQQLFYDVSALKCFYNNLRASDGNVKNIDLLSCYANEDTSVTLNTEELAKLRDWNIKDGEALGRWQNILNQFSPSLRNIENMEKSSTRRNYGKYIKRVQNYTLILQEEMTIIRKAYEKCNIDHSDTIIKVPDDIVKPYTKETLNELKITKEELAASIFKQIQIVLGVIKEDLIHRRKCLF